MATTPVVTAPTLEERVKALEVKLEALLKDFAAKVEADAKKAEADAKSIFEKIEAGVKAELKKL